MSEHIGRILIADDEDTFRMSTAELLRREGYECETAENGEEALQCLEKPFDLLIADIKMPGNVELEFLDKIQSREPTIPIIVVTGFPTVKTATQSLRLAVLDYVVKPLDMPSFKASVARGVQRGKLLRMLRETQETTKEWNTQMGQLTQSLTLGEAGKEEGLHWTLESYLNQTVTQMAKLTGNLQKTIFLSKKQEAESTADDVCELVQCPRKAAYVECLKETVDILEKTKRAFKSKDLGLLREKIENLLKDK